MNKVFIGGSRRISRIDGRVKVRIDNILKKGLDIVIGDANGVDKAVQTYLAEKQYQKVTVFCMAGDCRNNVGNWVTRQVSPTPNAKGFAYFSIKDRVMAEDADYGLMLWDGKSRGTLTSIVDLINRGRSVVIYMAGPKEFTTVCSQTQLTEFARRLDPALLSRVERDLLNADSTPQHHKL